MQISCPEMEETTNIQELSERFKELQNSVAIMNQNYVTLNYQVMGLQGHMLEEITRAKVSMTQIIEKINALEKTNKKVANSRCDIGELSVESENKITTQEELSASAKDEPPTAETPTTAELVKNDKREKEKMMPKKEEKGLSILEKRKRQYLSYVKYLLEKKNPEKWLYIASQQNLNKAIIFPGADPKFVRGLYDQGLIYCIFPGRTCREVEALPMAILESARTYFGITRAEQIYIRFYSTIPEFVGEEVIKAEHIVKIGITREPIIGNHVVQEFNEEQQLRIMTAKRALGYKIMYNELKEILRSEEIPWVYTSGKANELLIYSQSKVSQSTPKKQVIESWFNVLAKAQMTMSEETAQHFCQLMKKEIMHKCDFCEEKEDVTSSQSYDEDGIFIPTTT